MSSKRNQQPSLFSKSMAYHHKIAREQRQNKIKQLRQKFIVQGFSSTKQQQERPLNSQVLQNFWDIDASKLYLHVDQIFEALDNINGEKLQEENHFVLCDDILFLVLNVKDFMLPYSFKFLKDGNRFTATIVAYCFSFLAKQELEYWIPFMNEDARAMIYLQAQSEQQIDTIWYEDPYFRQVLIQDWEKIQQTQQMIIYMFQQNKQQSELIEFITQFFMRIFQKNKRNQLRYTGGLLTIIVQMMNYYLNYTTNNRFLKQFSFLRILLNQLLVKIYDLNGEEFEIKYDFVFELDQLYSQISNMGQLLLTDEAFQRMVKILFWNLEDLKAKTPKGPQKIQVQKDYSKQIEQKSSNKHYQSSRQFTIYFSYLQRVISISLSYVRINNFFKINSSIEQSNIQKLGRFLYEDLNNVNDLKASQMIKKIQQRYKKLIQINKIEFAKKRRDFIRGNQ